MGDALVKAQDVQAWSPEQRELVKRTCAAGATDDELAMYLHVAAASGLDPLRRQLHFLKVGGRVSFIADVNGLQERAAKEPDFEGIDHAVVYEGDDFAFDHTTGAVVKHTSNPFKMGKPIGAWAIVHRRGMRPFVSCVRFTEYFNPNNPLWQPNAKPSVMIDKCAKSTALRLAYPGRFSNVYDEAELGKEEVEVSPPPPPDGAAAVKQAVKARLKVVDVAPGETEEEAKAREAQPQPPAKTPTLWERVVVMAAEYGVTDRKTLGEVAKSATGKGKPAELADEDVPKIRLALEAVKTTPASNSSEEEPF